MRVARVVHRGARLQACTSLYELELGLGLQQGGQQARQHACVHRDHDGELMLRRTALILASTRACRAAAASSNLRL